VGIYDLRSGSRLTSARLHGPVVHLELAGQTLHAATVLGSHLAWDLGILDRDYCELVRQVWRRVPVRWESGRAVLRARPTGHPCARGE
jgi:hypothetical protein